MNVENTDGTPDPQNDVDSKLSELRRRVLKGEPVSDLLAGPGQESAMLRKAFNEIASDTDQRRVVFQYPTEAERIRNQWENQDIVKVSVTMEELELVIAYIQRSTNPSSTFPIRREAWLYVLNLGINPRYPILAGQEPDGDAVVKGVRVAPGQEAEIMAKIDAAGDNCPCPACVARRTEESIQKAEIEGEGGEPMEPSEEAELRQVREKLAAAFPGMEVRSVERIKTTGEPSELKPHVPKRTTIKKRLVIESQDEDLNGISITEQVATELMESLGDYFDTTYPMGTQEDIQEFDPEAQFDPGATIVEGAKNGPVRITFGSPILDQQFIADALGGYARFYQAFHEKRGLYADNPMIAAAVEETRRLFRAVYGENFKEWGPDAQIKEPEYLSDENEGTDPDAEGDSETISDNRPLSESQQLEETVYKDRYGVLRWRGTGRAYDASSDTPLSRLPSENQVRLLDLWRDNSGVWRYRDGNEFVAVGKPMPTIVEEYGKNYHYNETD